MVIDVLAALSVPRHEPLSLRGLAEVLSVPRSTLHRILRTLESKGVVERLSGHGYALGHRALALSLGYRTQEIHLVAQPAMHELRSEVGETVNLAVPGQDAMLVVAALESPHPLRTVSWVGQRNEFHASALGKSYVAALNDVELDQLLGRLQFTPVTKRTLSARGSVQREIDKTRARGFAIDDGESVEGTRCVGSGILAGGGHPIGALSISAPASRVSMKDIRQIGSVVAQVSQGISAEMGVSLGEAPQGNANG
jgi:IclR family acetate operon transcriptional repressor